MELRTLRYFLALAQEGTISNAAKALHVTQPTLSRQLADLERGFGKRLFERGAKRVVLTEDGQRLREYAESIVELADKAEAELSQPERAVAGDVYHRLRGVRRDAPGAPRDEAGAGEVAGH